LKNKVSLSSGHVNRKQSANHTISMSELSRRHNGNIDPYPWWEEQQCVPDTESFISDIEQSAKDQLEVDGWLLERGEQDASLDPFPPGLDAVTIAQRYIPAVEDWLRREVENPDDVSPVDGDVNP
jgi:hypothetical protein